MHKLSNLDYSTQNHPKGAAPCNKLRWHKIVPLPLLKGLSDFFLSQSPTPSPRCTLNNSHFYLTPCWASLAPNSFRPAAVGQEGGRRKLSVCHDSPTRQVTPSACAWDSPNLSSSLCWGTLSWCSLWKKHLWHTSNLPLGWSVTKGWMCFVRMKTSPYFWGVHWTAHLLWKCIRKGQDVLSSDRSFPNFLCARRSKNICFWEAAEAWPIIQNGHTAWILPVLHTKVTNFLKRFKCIHNYKLDSNWSLQQLDCTFQRTEMDFSSFSSSSL